MRNERTEPRWLDADGAAAYISVRVDALSRLVKQGRIPKPDYTLGSRSPRWDRLALDAAFNGGAASTDIRTAVQAGVEKIIQASRTRRQARAG